MNRDAIRIRVAALDDAEDLLAIYAPYVQNTAVTFEYDVPRLEDFQSRMETTLKQYPYIVAEKGGKSSVTPTAALLWGERPTDGRRK